MMTRSELDEIGPARCSALFLKQQIASAGWKMVDLAFWLGITRKHLSSVINDVHRPRHWELALCHLPKLPALERRRLTELRLAAEQLKTAKTVHVDEPSRAEGAAPGLRPGMRYHNELIPGAVVVVVGSHVGEMAEEGEEGVVVAVRANGNREEYQIRFTGGEDWFDADAFDESMAETGKMIAPAGLG